MKKLFIGLIIVIIVGVLISVMYVTEINKKVEQIRKNNQEYETYLNKEVLGTDVTTIINKSINQNEKNEILKDDKGFYIDNETNSIKVELIMLQEGKKSTYQMETLQKVGLNGFVKNFNLIKFKCSKIEYHEKTKYVKKIVFEQIEE